LETRLIKKGANLYETIAAIKEMINEESQKHYVKKISEQLLKNENCENCKRMLLANFAYNIATFKPDLPPTQNLKTPKRLIEDKEANCVQYTILIGSLAKANNDQVKLKIVQMPGTNFFGHIYPIINGQPIDIVPLQAQDGSEKYKRGKEYRYIQPIEKKFEKCLIFTI
jgi:hypothetical protein